MGYSRWDASANALYASATTLRSTQTREEIFTSRTMKEAFDPRKIVMRESRDSEQNPNSTPIIIGLDVTGSMGMIAEYLAKGELGKLMTAIFDEKPVTDPHVMVMAIGDATCDSAPLQVSQFEADIRIDDSLQSLYLEGRGGGNNFESYDLPWYFAANRTSTDAYEKRGKKGYLFTIGDEMPPSATPYGQHSFTKVFGDTQDAPTYNSRVALANAQEKYNVFHVIVEEGNYCRGRRDAVVKAWSSLLNKRALPLDNYNHISTLITTAMCVNEGADPVELIKQQQDPNVRRTLHNAFGI